MRKTFILFILLGFVFSLSSDFISDMSHNDLSNENSSLIYSSNNGDQDLHATDCHNDCESDDCEKSQHCMHHCHGNHNIASNTPEIRVRAPHCSGNLCVLSYYNGYRPPFIKSSNKPPISA